MSKKIVKKDVTSHIQNDLNLAEHGGLHILPIAATGWLEPQASCLRNAYQLATTKVDANVIIMHLCSVSEA